MKALKFILVTIALIGIIWLFGLVPRWITNTLLSIVLIVIMYIMYRIDKDIKK